MLDVNCLKYARYTPAQEGAWRIALACFASLLLTQCASTASEVSGEGLSFGGDGPVTELTSFPSSGCVSGVVDAAEAKVANISAIKVIYFRVENTNGDTMYSQTEWAHKYCFAGGGSEKPCQPWNSDEYPDGEYQLKVEAVMKNGQETTQSVPLRIDNANGCPSQGAPEVPEDTPGDAPGVAPGTPRCPDLALRCKLSVELADP